MPFCSNTIGHLSVSSSSAAVLHCPSRGVPAVAEQARAARYSGVGSRAAQHEGKGAGQLHVARARCGRERRYCQVQEVERYVQGFRTGSSQRALRKMRSGGHLRLDACDACHLRKRALGNITLYHSALNALLCL
eukprot:1159968-Pelagomonas_calceolata.AAC.18